MRHVRGYSSNSAHPPTARRVPSQVLGEVSRHRPKDRVSSGSSLESERNLDLKENAPREETIGDANIDMTRNTAIRMGRMEVVEMRMPAGQI